MDCENEEKHTIVKNTINEHFFMHLVLQVIVKAEKFFSLFYQA